MRVATDRNVNVFRSAEKYGQNIIPFLVSTGLENHSGTMFS
jgi:hypothetical protein